MDCFSRLSSASLDIYNGQIAVVLIPTHTIGCDFPSGVFIELNFIDPALDFYEIVTDFTYSEAYEFTAQIDNALSHKYEVIENLMINISSYSIESVFSIGRIENYRIRQEEQGDIQNNNLTISDDAIFFQFNRIYTDIADAKYKVEINDTDGAVYTFTEGFEEVNASCIKGAYDLKHLLIERIEFATLYIIGTCNGIPAVDVFSTNTILLKLANQPFLGSDAYFYNQHIAVVINSDEALLGRLQEHLAANAHTTRYKLTFHHLADPRNVTYLYGNFSDVMLKGLSGMLCSRSYDEGLCLALLREIRELELSSISVHLYVYFTFGDTVDNMLVFEIPFQKQLSICFEDIMAKITPQSIHFDMKRRQNQKECVLATPYDTRIVIGYYRDDAAREQLQAGLTEVFALQASDFTCDTTQLNIGISKKHYALLKREMSNDLHKQLFFFRDDAYADDAELETCLFYDHGSELTIVTWTSVFGVAVILIAYVCDIAVSKLCARRAVAVGDTKAQAADDL